MAIDIKVINGGSKGATNYQIDPRAVVHSSAQIGPGCVVEPFAVVGAGVRMGADNTIRAHCVLSGPLVMGDENTVHPFASIGGAPQDLRYRDEPTELIIGNGNEFREYVTVNRGTVHGGGATVIGDNNLIMAYGHIAHDCHLGNRIVMANHATLAGHIVVEDHVVFGGMVAVGTFLRIGESAMLAAGSMIERNVPPFCIVAGDRARLRAVNRVGLERREKSDKAKSQIKAIFKDVKAGLQVKEIVERFDGSELSSEGRYMLDFLVRCDRGITR